jgi:hypothetical protein
MTSPFGFRIKTGVVTPSQPSDLPWSEKQLREIPPFYFVEKRGQE